MTVLVSAVMAIGVLLGARLVDVTAACATTARAQATADATALAGVWGIDLARETARRNHGMLVDYESHGDTVTVIVSVVVSVDGVERAASAA